MKREEEFVISHDPFAIDMSTLASEPQESGSVICRVSAVWFRKRKRVLQACAGSLRAWFGGSTGSGTVPVNTAEFAVFATRRDNWASADCEARWDGRTFWAAPPMHPDLQRGYLELLEPMLAGFPAAPEEFDAWWRFTDVN